MTKQRKKRPIIALVILAALIGYAFSRGWLLPFQGAVLRAVSPVTAEGAGITGAIGDYFFSFLRVGTLSRTIRTLENKVAEKEALLEKLSGIERENKVLREQLQLLPKSKFKLVSADVISHSTDGGKDVLIINRGTMDGIKEGMPVIVNNGVVVGKIVRADSLVANIMLMTDANFKLAAIVNGTKSPGLIRGAKGLDVTLEEVPREEEIKPGESVITTGVDGIFPADLLVGKIRSVDAPENEIFQSAKVTPVIDIRKVTIVSVIVEK